jgi:hypothetical protein
MTQHALTLQKLAAFIALPASLSAAIVDRYGKGEEPVIREDALCVSLPGMLPGIPESERSVRPHLSTRAPSLEDGAERHVPSHASHYEKAFRWSASVELYRHHPDTESYPDLRLRLFMLCLSFEASFLHDPHEDEPGSWRLAFGASVDDGRWGNEGLDLMTLTPEAWEIFALRQTLMRETLEGLEPSYSLWPGDGDCDPELLCTLAVIHQRLYTDALAA